MVAIFYNATKEKFLNANDSYLLLQLLSNETTLLLAQIFYKFFKLIKNSSQFPFFFDHEIIIIIFKHSISKCFSKE